MADQILMDILNTADDLTKVELGLFLRDFVVLNKIIELSFWGQFHNHKDVIGGIKYFIKLDNVRMIDEFENFDLSFNLNSNKE